MHIYLKKSAQYVKTLHEWAYLAPRRSAESAARKYASKHGLAVIMRGDDSASIYRNDPNTDRIVKKTIRNVIWQ